MSLPSREDFGGDHPDIEWAWRECGGKSLEEAYEYFREAPDSLQESFMWMEERAFRFYYPTVDRYLRNVSPPEEEWDCWPAGILAKCIQTHFDCHQDMTGLHQSILSLCDFVCSNLNHFSLEDSEQTEIREAWSDLRKQVADDALGIRRPRR